MLATTLILSLSLSTALPGDPSSLSKRLLEKGTQLQKQEKYDEAIATLKQAAAANAPDAISAEILVELAETHFRKGKDASEGKLKGVPFEPALKTARDLFSQVVKRYPQISEQAAIAAYMVGSCNILLGDMERALEAYKAAYFNHTSEIYRPRALVRIGVSLAGTGDAQTAIKIFQAYLQQYGKAEKQKNRALKVRKYISQLQLVGKPATEIQADKWLRGVLNEGLADLKGEVIVIVFFATWCKNCGAELTHIKREIARWQDKGVVFLGVIDPDDPEATEPAEFYVNRHKIGFTDVALDKGAKYQRPYRVFGFPAAVIVDRNGMIRWRGHFAFIGHTLIEKLLSE